jgi:hypothetical protein
VVGGLNNHGTNLRLSNNVVLTGNSRSIFPYSLTMAVPHTGGCC